MGILNWTSLQNRGYILCERYVRGGLWWYYFNMSELVGHDGGVVLNSKIGSKYGIPFEQWLALQLRDTLFGYIALQ